MQPDRFNDGVFQGDVMAKLNAIHEAVKENRVIIAQNELRIRALENRFWYYAGFTAVGLAAPWVVKAAGLL